MIYTESDRQISGSVQLKRGTNPRYFVGPDWLRAFRVYVRGRDIGCLYDRGE